MDSQDPAAESTGGDAELIARVRQDDADALDLLRVRHLDGVTRLAGLLADETGVPVPAPVSEAPPSDGPVAETMVAQAFETARTELRAGGGPDLAFRPYVLGLLRDVADDRSADTGPLPTATDGAEPVPEPPGADSPTARAYLRMPERWRVALWHAEVEGDSTQTIALLLGLNEQGANNVVQRALDGLRRIHVQADLDGLPDACCAQRDRMADAARGRLNHDRWESLSAHLRGCERCRAVHDELIRAEANLGALIGYTVLGPMAERYARPPVHRTAVAPVRRQRLRPVPIAILAVFIVAVVAGWSVAFTRMAGQPATTGAAPSAPAPAPATGGTGGTPTPTHPRRPSAHRTPAAPPPSTSRPASTTARATATGTVAPVSDEHSRTPRATPSHAEPTHSSTAAPTRHDSTGPTREPSEHPTTKAPSPAPSCPWYRLNCWLG